MNAETVPKDWGSPYGELYLDEAGKPHFVCHISNVDFEKTKEALDIMMPGGGYIAGATHDSILEETPVENVVAMFDAIREFGSYS